MKAETTDRHHHVYSKIFLTLLFSLLGFSSEAHELIQAKYSFYQTPQGTWYLDITPELPAFYQVLPTTVKSLRKVRFDDSVFSDKAVFYFQSSIIVKADKANIHLVVKDVHLSEEECLFRFQLKEIPNGTEHLFINIKSFAETKIQVINDVVITQNDKKASHKLSSTQRAVSFNLEENVFSPIAQNDISFYLTIAAIVGWVIMVILIFLLYVVKQLEKVFF